MAEGEEKKPRRITVDDYDTGNVPSDYEMGNVITLTPRDAPIALHVGPKPTTKTRQKFVEERFGYPVQIPLTLPDMTERRLWKTDEAARWYAAYARKLHHEIVSKSESVYVHYKTGCEEEVVVAVLLWTLVDPGAVPKTMAAWKEWRESNAYLWIWDDRLDDTLAVVQAAVTELLPAQETKGSGSASLMVNWLRKSKDK